MIAEKDLQSAIAECQGERNPDARTCIKLAAYYTIKREMYPDHLEMMSPQSFDPPPKLSSGTEFAELANGRDVSELLQIMDELMQTIHVLHPRLYDSVIRKLEG